MAVTPLKPVKWGKLLITGGGATARAAARNVDDVPWHRAFCSFSEDTEVLLADGSTVPIGEIGPDDVVWATDPETDREGPRPVLAVWVHEDVLIDLELDGGVSVSTTVDHPFWNHTDQQWQRADTLDAGDELLTRYGSTVTVVGLDDTTARTGDAYNLTIANIHTYYVLAGDIPVLVHNTNECWRAADAADIARGHAGVKHAKDFPGMSSSDLEAHVRHVMTAPGRQKVLSNNRRAYLGQDGETVVIHDPMHRDGGTVFRRFDIDDYWEGLR